jgi:hypothetical protein
VVDASLLPPLHLAGRLHLRRVLRDTPILFEKDMEN